VPVPPGRHRRHDAHDLAAKAACALALVPGAASGAAHAATLRIATAFDPQTMDPHSQALQHHTRVVFQIYESLVGRDEDYRLVPVLATQWTQTDPLTWRFKLRPGVHFHDGSLFTAEDAVFSFERALTPPSQRQFVLKGVERVRMVDPLTIDFELAAPDAVLPHKLVRVAMMNKRWSLAHHVEHAQDYDTRQETFAVRNANGSGA
jgi:peptide/nickel transport system substrate-binding protein